MKQKNQPVYKYRSGGTDSKDIEDIFKRDLKSLEDNEFYAPKAEMLNDPCEGFISTKILIEELDKMLEKNPHAVKSVDYLKNELNNMLGHNQTSGIYSLSKDNLDELLWAHYANSHKGFCIEYDLEMLLKLNKEIVLENSKKELLSFNINYEKQPYSLTSKDMNNLKDVTIFMTKVLGYKSLKWKYEDEVRIICPQSGVIKHDYRAVKSIYFGFKMEEEQENKIMKKLQGRGIQYYKIKLKKDTYKFYPEAIKDLYKTDKKYLYSIAPIEEYAMTIINDNSDDYYYKRVAEIARREPYCNSLLNIKKDNNFFEVYFLKEHPIFLKQKYTLREIDKLYNEIDDLE